MNVAVFMIQSRLRVLNRQNKYLASYIAALPVQRGDFYEKLKLEILLMEIEIVELETQLKDFQ